MAALRIFKNLFIMIPAPHRNGTASPRNIRAHKEQS